MTLLGELIVNEKLLRLPWLSILAICAIHGGNEEPRPIASPRGSGSKRESGCGPAFALATSCEWCFPCGGTGRANRRDQARPRQNGRRPHHRPGQYAPRSRTDRSVLFARRGRDNPLGQELSDFLYWRGTASLGVADAFINRGKGLLVFLVLNGCRVVEVNSIDFGHTFTVARISG